MLLFQSFCRELSHVPRPGPLWPITKSERVNATIVFTGIRVRVRLYDGSTPQAGGLLTTFLPAADFVFSTLTS